MKLVRYFHTRKMLKVLRMIMYASCLNLSNKNLLIFMKENICSKFGKTKKDFISMSIKVRNKNQDISLFLGKVKEFYGSQTEIAYLTKGEKQHIIIIQPFLKRSL